MMKFLQCYIESCEGCHFKVLKIRRSKFVCEHGGFLQSQSHIYYIIVPPNCTEKLQPLKISVNKPAKEYL